MPINLKLRHLEGFIVAAEEKSFVRAAAILAMSAPAFSQLIRDFENSIGVTLFDRTTRSVVLTPMGEQLLSLVKRPVDDLADSQRWLKDVAAGRRGKVTFSILHSLAFTLGTRAVAQFLEVRPEVDVHLIEDQNNALIEKVLTRQVDFGVGMFTENLPGLLFEPLLEDDLVAVFPDDHALAKKKVVGWSDLARSPLVLLREGSSVRQLVDAGLLVSNTPRERAIEVVSMVTAVQFAKARLGITVVPRVSWSALETTGLCFRSIGPPAPIRSVGILRLAERADAEVERQFLDLLRKLAAS